MRTLFVRVPLEQHRRLKLLAVQREVRVAELVREALDRYLSKEAPDGKA
jgi:predicted DNA-binding protein